MVGSLLMGIAKYLFMSVLLLSSNAFADSSCIECMKHKANNIEGLPGNNELSSLAKASGSVTQRIASKESYQTLYCEEFQYAQDSVDVESIFDHMDESTYAQNAVEFWTSSECVSRTKVGSKVPMIFNTAYDVNGDEDYPKIVREYLLEVKKDSSTWLKMINAHSSDGLTFLDYLQYNLEAGRYKSADSKAAANRIVQYLCKYGGVYFKYKESKKCP